MQCVFYGIENHAMFVSWLCCWLSSSRMLCHQLSRNCLWRVGCV